MNSWKFDENLTYQTWKFPKNVRRYHIRIKKFINAYGGKINKIHQRCGLLSRNSLGLGEPYITTKNYLVFTSY